MEQKITSLTAQKKNPNRVNVYLDGKYAFGLSRIVAAWLHVGQTITQEKIDHLQRQDAEEVVYQKALHTISYRQRSEAEVKEKLKTKGYDDGIVERVIERLRINGMVGDAAFARDWIENRTAFRPRSKKHLSLELRQKGISEDIIQDAIEVSEVDEDGLALQLARNYGRRLGALDWQKFRLRLGAYLGRRGFSYDTVSTIVRQVWNEMKQDNQFENLSDKDGDNG
jgi:regulatory protein